MKAGTAVANAEIVINDVNHRAINAGELVIWFFHFSISTDVLESKD